MRHDVALIKKQLSHLLHTPSSNQKRGFPTALSQLNRYLPWQGLPREGLSLIKGPVGYGSTSFWLQVASKASQENLWALWVNNGYQLTLSAIKQYGINQNCFLVAEKETSSPNGSSLFLFLKEIIQSEVIDLISLPLVEKQLNQRELTQLKMLCLQFHVSLVILQFRSFSPWSAQLFSLIIEMSPHHLVVQRTRYRPTPRAFSKTSHLSLIKDSLTVEIDTFSNHTALAPLT